MTVGTATWVRHTSGRLTSAERHALLRPLARTHVTNAVGWLRHGAFAAAIKFAPFDD